MVVNKFCSVSNKNCVAPAGYGGNYGIVGNINRYAILKCYACGNPVCSKCSKIVIYHSNGKKRLCDNCRQSL